MTVAAQVLSMPRATREALARMVAGYTDVDEEWRKVAILVLMPEQLPEWFERKK